MASPIGHSLVGVSIYLLMPPGKVGETVFSGWKGWVGVVLLTNLPDIDFVFGLMKGDPHRYHGIATHSLWFAAMVGLGLGFLIRHRAPFMDTFWRSAALIASHDFVDFFSGQTLGFSHGEGVALLYPFSGGKYASPFTVFYGVLHRDMVHLFSATNFRHMVYEIVVLGSVAAFLFYRRRRKGNGREFE